MLEKLAFSDTIGGAEYCYSTNVFAKISQNLKLTYDTVISFLNFFYIFIPKYAKVITSTFFPLLYIKDKTRNAQIFIIREQSNLSSYSCSLAF